MTPAPPPPPTFDERISRVRLWPLVPILMVVGLMNAALRRLGVPSAASLAVSELLLYLLVLGWWLLRVVPRPFSPQTALGRPLDRASLTSVAMALFGVTCVRLIWWHHPAIVNAISGGGAFSYAASTWRLNWTIVITVVLAPVVEEVFFRGTLFRKWRLRWGPAKALLLSTLLFAAIHEEVVATTLTGFTYALVYTRARTLRAPIAMHVFNNAALSGLAFASYLRGSPELIHLDSPWEASVLALVLLAGTGLWLAFVVKSWRTLGDPLPPDSLQSAPVTPPSTAPEPVSAAL